MYIVYILYSDRYDRYYIGSTKDLQRRLERHNTKCVRSTKYWVPWRVVYCERFKTRALAMKREKKIKKYKRGKAFEKLLDQS